MTPSLIAQALVLSLLRTTHSQLSVTYDTADRELKDFLFRGGPQRDGNVTRETYRAVRPLPFCAC